jgi:hypothetical protein
VTSPAFTDAGLRATIHLHVESHELGNQLPAPRCGSRPRLTSIRRPWSHLPVEEIRQVVGIPEVARRVCQGQIPLFT